MEPRERSCLDGPSGLLFILAGAPISLARPHVAHALKTNCLAVTGFLWFLHIPVAAVVELLQGPIQNLCRSAGFPVPTLTPGCWNDSISCLVPAAAACQALSYVVEMGRLLGVRLNEGHLVCRHHSSQNFGGLSPLFRTKIQSVSHRCEAANKIHH